MSLLTERMKAQIDEELNSIRRQLNSISDSLQNAQKYREQAGLHLVNVVELHAALKTLEA